MLIWLIVTVINLNQIQAASLICYNSSDVYTVTPLKTPRDIQNTTFFDIYRKTIIYVFGYTASKDGEYTVAVKDAALKYIVANYIILDWEKEASGGDLGVFGYPLSAVRNAKEIGEQLGDAILQLVNDGLDLSTLHLVGHSLGAQLLSHTGRYLKDKGEIVGRITGLDPAGPLYSGPYSLRGLEPSSAAYVDVIHTAPGTYGTPDNVGKVDIWVNCDLKVQPGCENAQEDKSTFPFTPADSCSHKRAPLIYAESLGNPTAFPAIQASDCDDWKNNYNGDGDIVYIGEDIDTKARGKFYLRINSEKPFGLGDKGLQP